MVMKLVDLFLCVRRSYELNCKAESEDGAEIMASEKDPGAAFVVAAVKLADQVACKLRWRRHKVGGVATHQHPLGASPAPSQNTGHSLGQDPNGARSSALVAARAAERMSIPTNSASNAQDVEGWVRGQVVASSWASERALWTVDDADVGTEEMAVMGVVTASVTDELGGMVMGLGEVRLGVREHMGRLKPLSKELVMTGTGEPDSAPLSTSTGVPGTGERVKEVRDETALLVAVVRLRCSSMWRGLSREGLSTVCVSGICGSRFETRDERCTVSRAS